MSTISKNLVLTFSIASLGVAVCIAGPANPTAPAAAPAGTNAAGPRIKFDIADFDFGKAKAGDPIKHTFIFTNIGTELLEITSVAPHCGCTTSGEWSKKVEPGKSGAIPIQVNSANLQGPVTKTVTVNCNDKSQPSITLQMKGTIWKPVEISPQFAVLNVPPDAPTIGSTAVRILNNMEEPITLSPPEINNKSFTAELKTNQLGKEYQLVVSAIPPLPPGNVQAQITLKTSSTNVPVLTVTAWANVQPAIVVMPPSITLPAGPLATTTSPTVTIQNNGTNLLKLSDPVISAKGVDVQLKEVNPGRTFSAFFTFPAGFEIAQGEQIEFKIKSSHPKYPEIKVPVTQLTRPPATLVPAKPATSGLTVPPLPRPPNTASVPK